MYFKVAIIVSTIVLFSGCSNPFTLKPKNPKANSKLGVKVVEEVSESDGSLSEEHIRTLEDDQVKVNKPKASKPNLKPEPFSLESNEEDPELLGPQSTLGKPLTRNEETKEESNTTVN